MRTGILIVNLGTPDSPSTSDVRTYLDEFLNDPRVIDLPGWKRWLLVNLIIVPFRSPKSAKLYKEIWTDKGSPLLIHGEKLRDAMQIMLGENFVVELAMRYRKPSIEAGLEKLLKAGVEHIQIFPLFPQYASASTGTVHQEVMRILSKKEVVPSVSFVKDFFDHPLFIESWKAIGSEFNHAEYDHILFSFHGLPERQILKADDCNHCLKPGCCDNMTEQNRNCYKGQCYATARAMAASLNIHPDNYTVCFQSRLGKDPWIKPYSDEVIKDLAFRGVKKILAYAPAFVADCLETIYEIGVEYDELAKEEGAEYVHLVTSLNSHPKWMEAMKGMILENLPAKI